MDNNKEKKLVITILLQKLILLENLSYESKIIIYNKIITQFERH